MEYLLLFSVEVRICLVLIGGENYSKKRWLYFFVIATCLSCTSLSTVTAKQQMCRFLVHKRNIQNVAAGFALFTVVENSRFIGWKVSTFFLSTCWTIHISDILFHFVVLKQFFLPKFDRLIKSLNNNCLLGTKLIFFNEEKDFFLFCLLYVLL